ncbi:RNA methyltransferase, TrmA family, putative [Eimeria acervulina]|uniref:RNA methyltransferase, TrmA family, putative n=1 Tax=Eimeria acervulina TaxID=5801 RepID=U6GF55_EIMAC|nr:RNA methyltransferase, TrmA family, putative [Eimeria acervulina]CDI78886.1 RNA methyltransferase, TrmA family, putative [Eimeria acervulina]
MQQARKGAHAKGLKSLEGTAPPASEASRPYGTAAAITTSAAEKLTDASANTRVLAAGEDAGEATDDICSSNGTMSNSDDATSDNHLGGETTKTTNGSISSSNSNNSCNGSVLGALNVVRTAEEGDILRGLKLIHLGIRHQRTAKKQLLQQMLQELQRQQQLHQQQRPQQQRAIADPPTATLLVPVSSETQFAARADLVLQLVEGRPRLGLPAFDGRSSIVSVEDCIRHKGPLREVLRHLREVLLPLLENRRLRILDQRSGAGTLSGLTLRLAEDCRGGDRKVLLRLKGHLESSVRPHLVHLAETLCKRCPLLKAVTFYDLGRPYSPDEVLLGEDALLVSVFGRRYRVTGGTRESIVGSGNSLQQIWPAVKDAAGGVAGRLWGALSSGGLFEILLSFNFKEVVVFASGVRDAEETRKNISLNELYGVEVVPCTDSRSVAGAFAARSGFYGPLRTLRLSPHLQQGNIEEKSTECCVGEERATEGKAPNGSTEAASAAATAAGESGGSSVTAAALGCSPVVSANNSQWRRYELAFFQAFDISPHTAEVLSVSAFLKRHLDLPQAESPQKVSLTRGLLSRQESGTEARSWVSL